MSYISDQEPKLLQIYLVHWLNELQKFRCGCGERDVDKFNEVTNSVVMVIVTTSLMGWSFRRVARQRPPGT